MSLCFTRCDFDGFLLADSEGRGSYTNLGFLFKNLLKLLYKADAECARTNEA